MRTTQTPILDLDTLPPQSSSGVSVKGLLKAFPTAIAIVLIIPAIIFVQSRLQSYWLTEHLVPVSRTLGPFLKLPPFQALAVLYFGMWSVTLIHEAGHAVAAILLRWRILEVRVAPFSIRNRDGKWKIGFSWRSFPGGLVLADPRSTRFHSRLRFFAIAGPAANLATFMAIFITPPPSEPFSSALLGVIFSWSLITTLLNLLPIRVRNLELDGYMAFVVSRTPARLAVRLATLKIRNHVLAGKSLVEVNQRWIAVAESSGKTSWQGVGGVWLAYSYWMEKDEYDRAARVFERILDISGSLSTEARGIVYSECAVIQAFRKREKAARTWEERASRFSRRQYLKHRVNSCMAFMDDNLDRAYNEAQLTSAAATTDLENKTVREAFLKSWNRWIKEIEEKRSINEKPHSEAQSHVASVSGA